MEMNAEQKLEHIRKLGRERAKKHHELHKADINVKANAHSKLNREAINAKRRATTLAKKEAIALANPVPIKKKLRIKGITFGKLDDLIGDKIENKETKQGHLSAIKAVMRLTYPELAWAFEDADKLIHAIDNGKMQTGEDYSLASKLKQYEAILKLSTVLGIPLDRPRVDDAHKIIKMKLEDEKDSKEQTEYPSFKTYLDECATLFGTDSREYLIAFMYSEFTCRDDLGLIVTDKPLKKVNYLLVQKTKMTIVLNEYKMFKDYGQIKHVCSAELTKLIKEYCVKKSIGVGDLLFGVPQLTDIVSLTNKRLGYSTGINLYRHMKVNDVLKDASYEDRLALSKQMGHSPAMQLKYLR